ncbi:MAG: fibronectin type III domain-containing protein [Flavobacteriales bacterium]|nr:fibronectin type III domain-containing protein [Flavobacteriales bacterium]
MANIKLSLSRLIPGTLLALLRYVVSKMTGNAHFATPAVPLADMTTLGDELEVAINKAKHGGLEDRILRNNLVLDVRSMLRKQADYVRLTAQGDAAILASSGFELSKVPVPVGLPGTPFIRFVRMTGKQGEAEVVWTAQHGADAYHVRITDKDPNIQAEWQVVGITTKSRFMLTDLESYKAYWVSVSAIGAAGEGLMSDPAIARAA